MTCRASERLCDEPDSAASDSATRIASAGVRAAARTAVRTAPSEASRVESAATAAAEQTEEVMSSTENSSLLQPKRSRTKSGQSVPPTCRRPYCYNPHL